MTKKQRERLWELSREYLKELTKSKPSDYVLNPWEEELAKWEIGPIILTQPGPSALAKLTEWDRQRKSN